ncbi:MAG: SGNH/GDSL hydrolase family protein [Thermodesulfobacteriota bacterium]
MAKNPAQNEGKKNFFERHPKKTLGVLLVLVILVLTLVADRLLAFKIKSAGPHLQRYVRLREMSPLTVEVFNPKPQVFDTEAGSQPRQVTIRADEQGFIVPSRVHDEPDAVLAFLGGSTTECRAVPEDQRFPYLVGRLLEDRLRLKVNSYNAARSGNNTLHSLNILLHKVLPLEPDVVVMMHNVNDLITLLYEETYWNQNPSRRVIVEVQPTLENQVRGFFQVLRGYTVPHLYAALKELTQRAGGADQNLDEFAHIRGRQIDIDQPYLVQEFASNLLIFMDICWSRGITPVLMTQANRFAEHLDSKTWREVAVLEAQGISYEKFRELYLGFNQVIRDQGAANEVLVVDLAREILPEQRFIHDPVHLTERGSKLTADIISRELEPVVRERLQGTETVE